ncbi:MAG TPA: HAMP domain-containing sensor histidine kinase [Bosea sp. (in: a-proteobacteria)]|jgi:signal transduction histidine kinase|uniref:sensor histidine kinase n=1 Tax=Bosea sp. (in: a-proteobacteria) TaxID=1871050 RepID=UPI002DDD24CF|nr:HAMP domain-containing sensor histidine kinase [Bosea sp. (in: a-proteobacteria)]HEV2556862.1 HAMP domain-containing sensor histidine kinase [Bosea sp. (in: a-proteobacteria)]
MPFRPHRYSLGARLFVSAAVCCALVLVLAGAGLTTFYRRSAERGFDERLSVYIKELIADLAAPPETERQAIGDLGEPRFDLPLSGWYWQIIRLDGERPTIRASRSLVGGQLPKLLDQPILPNARGIRESYISGPDDRSLRILEREIDVGEDGRFTVAVAAPSDELDADIREFRFALTMTFVLLGLALVASTIVQVRFGLRPLARLRSAVGMVRTGETPRIVGQYPPDLAPLAGELNLLIDANHEILDRARTQVGNLAHALKTPLSVMLNEAEIGDGNLPQTVKAQAAVMRDQVQYYLDRARAAALSGALGGVTEVVPSLEALIRTFAKISQGRGIAGSHSVSTGVRFRGDRQDFEEMLGNLLDNAFKWAESTVAVSLDPAPAGSGRIVLLIDDDGPGLPDDARADMLKRGRRLDEGTPGSGLGLSIVVDLAKLHGGALSLERSPLGGLRARLTLPSV